MFLLATAQVMTVSSVKKQSSQNKEKSFVLVLFHSYTEPTMSPTIAPSIRFLLMAYQIRYTFLMSHSFKMASPNQSTHKAGKLINNRGYSPLLHTKLYLNVADEIISLILSHSSILFHHRYTEPEPC